MRGRRLSAVVWSASLALVLVACGGDDDDETSAGAGQTPASTVTTSAAAPTTASPTTTTASSAAGEPTVATADSSLGTIFVDAEGMTLYTFDPDTDGVSTCTGGCATTWPPLLLPRGTAAPVPGDRVSQLSVAPRPDDSTRMQVNWDGQPLYTYAGDTAPGDTEGDGLGGNWHVARPSS